MPPPQSPDDAGWDPNAYARAGAFVPRLARDLVDLLDPRPGERILDLGCGDGALTAELAARGAEVVGVDSSAEMVAAARARGVDARVADAAALPFTGEFDAVFSNAALHWMPLDAALAGARRSLRPGGRFVAECGGHGNVAAITVALVSVLARRGIDGYARRPWTFPTAADMSARLRAAGFTVQSIELFARPTVLDTSMQAWLALFARPFLDDLDDAEAARVRDDTATLLAPVLRDESGTWTADYVRLRFTAVAA